jgi:hypothetical protein
MKGDGVKSIEATKNGFTLRLNLTSITYLISLKKCQIIYSTNTLHSYELSYIDRINQSKSDVS